jgi:hypothetical protein
MPTTITFQNPPPSGSSIVVYFGSKTSRFTRVFRVNYPMVPQPPSAFTADFTNVIAPTFTAALPLTFDKNIYGLIIDSSQFVLATSPDTIGLVSDSDTDTRVATVTGLDVNGSLVIETVTLDGTTVVFTDQVFSDLISVKVG